MEQPLKIDAPGITSADFEDKVSKVRSVLGEKAPVPIRVLDLRTNAVDQLAGAFAAITSETPVHWFLGVASWSGRDRDAATEVAQPNLIIRDGDGFQPVIAAARVGRSESNETLLMIATGGSTGKLRFAAHTPASLRNAARSVVGWCGGGPLNCVCFLPVFHVSGLMQAMRSWVSGGSLVLCSWSDVDQGLFPVQHGGGIPVTSVVPTQLARILDRRGGAEWLRTFRCVFVGGAPASSELLERARRERIRLAPCYGMTETAAQIAAMDPAHFLIGEAIAGHVLEHAKVDIIDPDSEETLGPGEIGRIAVEATSLFSGYYPEIDRVGRFLTSDLGFVDENGLLTVTGRIDNIVNTGGEKVNAREVEDVLRDLPGVTDAFVFGHANREWGEAIVAAIACPGDGDEQRLRQLLRDVLAAHKIPKHWLFMNELPRTPAGKIDRRALTTMLSGKN